jgi:hypothetical protein
MSILLSSSLVAALIHAPAPPRSSEPDAGTILAKAIRVHGGEAALARYPAVRLKIRRTEEPTRFSYAAEWLFAAPNRFKVTAQAYSLGREVQTIHATDGKVAWSLIEERTRELQARQAEWYRDQAHLLQVRRLLPLKQKQYQLNLIGTTKVEGNPAVGLRVQTQGQKDLILFFDSESGLLVKIEFNVIGSGGTEVKEEHLFQDYQKKEPLPFARKMIIKQDGQTVESHEIREAKFLEKADDKEFQRK